MIDPSLFRTMFDVINDGVGNQQFRPLGGPLILSSRMRILAGGQVLEDIDMYNAVNEMFSIFSVLQIAERMIMAKACSKSWDNM